MIFFDSWGNPVDSKGNPVEGPLFSDVPADKIGCTTDGAGNDLFFLKEEA